MITTEKILDLDALKEAGLVGVWYGNPTAKGKKNIYAYNETAPEGLNGCVCVGWCTNKIDNEQLQQIINDYDYETAQKKAILKDVRSIRDKLLKESDWVLIRDNEQIEMIKNKTKATKIFDDKFNKKVTRVLDDKKRKEWLEYRQALRDLPSVYLENKQFPSVPE